jgi:signal transduction histidine kinase
LVKEVVKLETRTAQFDARNVTVTVAANLPDVWLSRPRCSRLVSNLLRNAAQATGAGGNIEVTVQSAGSDSVELVVQDSGPGVPADLRERIFDPLFTTKTGQGTGLGLSICKTIVEGHGGALELAPSAGQGARFVARFPT